MLLFPPRPLLQVLSSIESNPEMTVFSRNQMRSFPHITPPPTFLDSERLLLLFFFLKLQ